MKNQIMSYLLLGSLSLLTFSCKDNQLLEIAAKEAKTEKCVYAVEFMSADPCQTYKGGIRVSFIEKNTDGTPSFIDSNIYEAILLDLPEDFRKLAPRTIFYITYTPTKDVANRPDYFGACNASRANQPVNFLICKTASLTDCNK